MVKLEKVVEKFYLGLEEGKILGRQCQKCGALEFPPVYACNSCGCTDLEWVEISGKAKMLSVVMPAQLSFKPEYKDLKPYAYGEVELEEGARLNAVVRGINKKKAREIIEGDLLPLNCHAAIYQREGFKTVVFDLDDEQ